MVLPGKSKLDFHSGEGGHLRDSLLSREKGETGTHPSQGEWTPAVLVCEEAGTFIPLGGEKKENFFSLRGKGTKRTPPNLPVKGRRQPFPKRRGG